MVPLILGIAGGSGAGKTTVAQRIVKAIDPQLSLIISQDTYYRNWEDLPLQERGEHNFDHPAAFDNRLLAQHLRELRQGNSVPKLWYDYRSHTRGPSQGLLLPKELIVVEGILLLEDQELRKVFDLKIWVETDSDLRFIRRLRRDMEERGRTLNSVISQYLSTVRPMWLKFVEPSRRYADLVVSGEGEAAHDLNLAVERIKSLLQKRGERWMTSLRRG